MQESIISCIYVWCTAKMVHDSYNPRTKRCIRVFVAVQVVCFLLDLPFIVLVIDEVHNILAGTYREQRIVLNTLRFLSNRLQISLVCFGVSMSSNEHGSVAHALSNSTR